MKLSWAAVVAAILGIISVAIAVGAVRGDSLEQLGLALVVGMAGLVAATLSLRDQ